MSTLPTLVRSFLKGFQSLDVRRERFEAPRGLGSYAAFVSTIWARAVYNPPGLGGTQRSEIVTIAWIAQRVEILMTAGVLFSVVLFALAVFAVDGSRMLAYPVLIFVFWGVGRGARAARLQATGQHSHPVSLESPTAGPQSSFGVENELPMRGEGASWLLDDLASRGFKLWVDGDDLLVEGESQIDSELAEAIRTNKQSLMYAFGQARTRPSR